MSSVGGPYLERLRDALVEWYPQYRQKLMNALTEDGPPYGHVRIPPTAQVSDFFSKDPNGWAMLITQLNERYRGLPDATARVNHDLTAYIRQMIILGNQAPPPTEPVFSPTRENVPLPRGSNVTRG